jgi:hypothetical protein
MLPATCQVEDRSQWPIPLAKTDKFRYTMAKIRTSSAGRTCMKATDPSLSRPEPVGYLRRYQPYNGFHLATCYP